jgi:hypothetical protein
VSLKLQDKCKIGWPAYRRCSQCRGFVSSHRSKLLQRYPRSYIALFLQHESGYTRTAPNHPFCEDSFRFVTDLFCSKKSKHLEAWFRADCIGVSLYLPRRSLPRL